MPTIGPPPGPRESERLRPDRTEEIAFSILAVALGAVTAGLLLT